MELNKVTTMKRCDLTIKQTERYEKFLEEKIGKYEDYEQYGYLMADAENRYSIEEFLGVKFEEDEEEI